MKVTLTEAEYRFAAHAGFLRHVDAAVAKRKAYHGYRGDGISIDVQGAVGEYVVSRALNLHWSGPGSVGGPDVGPLQVRSTARHNGGLILHPRDAVELPFYLVVGSYPDYRVAGWVYGNAGARPEFWRRDIREAAYVVPQSELTPVDVLPDCLCLARPGPARPVLLNIARYRVYLR